MSWVLGKLVFLLLRPSNLLILLGLAGLVLAWRGRRTGLRLATLAVGAIALVTLLPVGLWLTRPLETRFPQPALPERVDGIVVLGGGTAPHLFVANGRPDFDDAGDRYLAMIELARRFPEAKVLFTGGIGEIDGAPVAETDVVAPLAVRLVRVGEESGRLAAVAEHLADAFEERLATRLTRLVALVEPLVIVTLGLLVGGIVVSILAAVVAVNDLAF